MSVGVGGDVKEGRESESARESERERERSGRA